MSLGLIIFLILLGLLLFIIEFMLIPGMTIAGIGGAICLVTGIVFSFFHSDSNRVYCSRGNSLAIMVVTTYFMLKAGTWKKFMLKTTIDGKVDTVGGAEGR